jgi:hypothetical protein
MPEDYLHHNPCRKGLVLRPEDTCTCMLVQVLAVFLCSVLVDEGEK